MSLDNIAERIVDLETEIRDSEEYRLAATCGKALHHFEIALLLLAQVQQQILLTEFTQSEALTQKRIF